MNQAPTKAVVLARGLGSRMRQASQTGLSPDQQRIAALGVKAMMPINGHPFIDYVLSALADAGLTDICLVIGPEHDMVRDYFASQDLRRLKVSFAVQAEPLGTANAVQAAKDFAGSERFVVVNSDNYYPTSALKELVKAPGSATVGFKASALIAHSNIPAERIAAFALLSVDVEQYLVNIIEKPSPEIAAQYGPDALVSMNCFLFGPSIFAACETISPSPRGEYEITDAVRAVVQTGEPVTVVPAAAGVFDMSGRADVPAVVTALAGCQVRL